MLLPSLGSARFGLVLARAFGQKAGLGLLSFSKSSYLKNSANTSFLKNFEKDHWQSTVLMGKFQFFLSTMAPKGHFQPKDWSKMFKICQKWPKSWLYIGFMHCILKRPIQFWKKIWMLVLGLFFRNFPPLVTTMLRVCTD